ncbi:hypothetical protein Tco_1187796 [Tanacetum coccineum]
MLLKQSDLIVLEKKVNIKPINYAELNRLSEDFGERFVPQQELSDEQAFRLQTSHPNTDQSASSPVKIDAPQELSKASLVNISCNTPKIGRSRNILPWTNSLPEGWTNSPLEGWTNSPWTNVPPEGWTNSPPKG